MFKKSSSLQNLAFWRLEPFFKDLAYLLKSGLPILTALALLEKSYTMPLQAVAKQLNHKLQQGLSLSQAWQATISHKLSYVLFQTAEQSGQLTEVLFQLHYFAKYQQQMRSFIWQGLRYPLFLLALLLLMLFGMCYFIIPQFSQLYQSFNVPLPKLTQYLIDLSHAVTQQGYMIIVGLIILGILIKLFQKKIISLTLKYLERFSSFKQRWQEWQFWQALNVLLVSGTPFLTAAKMSYPLLPYHKHKLFLYCLSQIGQGQSISQTFNHSNLFSAQLIQLCTIGETAGQLTTLLTNYVEQEKLKLQEQLEQFKTWFEPLMICTIGALLGVILLALYLPMIQLGKYI